jgi:fatty-acyl-CoA synthase
MSDEIIAYCTQRLARHIVPKDVVFIDRLPMNAHGKIVKAELKKLAAQPTSEPVQ